MADHASLIAGRELRRRGADDQVDTGSAAYSQQLSDDATKPCTLLRVSVHSTVVIELVDDHEHEGQLRPASPVDRVGLLEQRVARAQLTGRARSRALPNA